MLRVDRSDWASAYRVSALESQIWMATPSGTVVPKSLSTPRGSRTLRAR